MDPFIDFVEWCADKYFDLISTPVVPSVPMPAAIPQQPKPIPITPKSQPSRVSQFCNAIQTYEGYILPGGRDGAGNVYVLGSPAYKNKNPGNIRCFANDKADWPSLTIGCSPDNFCIFKIYEDGYTTLVNGVTRICLGNVGPTNPYAIAAKKLGLASCKNMTINQFFEVRDPPSDGNDPDKYGKFVGSLLGVDSATFTMAQLVE